MTRPEPARRGQNAVASPDTPGQGSLHAGVTGALLGLSAAIVGVSVLRVGPLRPWQVLALLALAWATLSPAERRRTSAVNAVLYAFAGWVVVRVVSEAGLAILVRQDFAIVATVPLFFLIATISASC